VVGVLGCDRGGIAELALQPVLGAGRRICPAGVRPVPCLPPVPAAAEDLCCVLGDEARRVVLVADQTVAVVVDRPKKPAGRVVRPVVHRLKPLPRVGQLERLDDVGRRVELLERLSLEGAPFPEDERPVPGRSCLPRRLHRLDIVGREIVVDQPEVDARHPRVTTAFGDQPPVLPGG
jgi:hypothetical protein